jgi:hypothetical protein
MMKLLGKRRDQTGQKMLRKDYHGE